MVVGGQFQLIILIQRENFAKKCAIIFGPITFQKDQQHSRDAGPAVQHLMSLRSDTAQALIFLFKK